jgi:large subunit ribosomal protein L31
MKEKIHPNYYPVVFVDGEHEVISKSTVKSGKTREIEGVTHYIIETAISSYTHPFWTGQTRMLDTAGRVERFNRRYNRG